MLFTAPRRNTARGECYKNTPVKTVDKAGFMWYYGFNYKGCDEKVANLKLYREAAVGASR